VWKITLFFSMYNSTWTETYYASGSISFAQLSTWVIQLGLLRLGLCAKQVSWIATRIVLLSQPRQAIFIGTNNLPTQGTFTLIPGTDPDQDSAPAFVAVQVKFFGVHGFTTRRYLAGAPEAIVSTQFTGRNIGVLGLWRNAMNAFLNALSVTFSFRYANQAAKQNVLQVTQPVQAGGNIAVSFPIQMIAQVPGVPNQLLLRGFRSANTRLFGLGGVYTVDPNSPALLAGATAPYVYYLLNTSRVLATNIIKVGYGSQLTYAYEGFGFSTGPDGTGYSILSVNHRKRGVSALALRGRSRTKP
jgi:hypothetical protein